MDIRFEKLEEAHGVPVIDIFNHYNENSHAVILFHS